ncbi:hypothetical protein QBC34DRAFT_212297 [Podospora aff. communis PSN243]|uniref:Uncharacterized protein n=1 Tax=Podospora aff. communis PSN243 TaxID=3040156 RepID=A0AAV9G5D1_9PEZI|nr:hypothetical protein QBC34DRAFT_212297 [Podospora aff. communis PSN243]
MDPATIASIVTLAVGAAIKVPDVSNKLNDILKSSKDLKALELHAEICKDRLREFKAEINRLDIPPALYRQTRALIRYSRGVVQAFVDYNKKYGDSFWARCMHWAAATRRSRTEIFERRLTECALWVRIASATSFLLAYRGGCGRIPGVLELCQTRAQQLRADVVQAKTYWRKYPSRMEKHMAVAVKLSVFRRYWGLAHDPMFEVLKSELSTPAGTSLGLSSPEEQPPRQYWRGIPVVMAAGPVRRAPEEEFPGAAQEHGMYFVPPVVPLSPYSQYPAPTAGPWYAGQGYGTTSYIREAFHPDEIRQVPPTPGFTFETPREPPEPVMTPAVPVPGPVLGTRSDHRPGLTPAEDGERSPSKESRRRRRQSECRASHSSVTSQHRSVSGHERASNEDHRRSRSSRYSESSRRSDSSRQPESVRAESRQLESSRRARRDDSEESESRYSRSSSRRSRHYTDIDSDDDHVSTTRSSSLVSSIRDSIFSRAHSLSSRSSYVSMRSSEYSDRTAKSRQSSRSSSVEAAAPEPPRRRGGDRRCPPNSAMNGTKAREKVRRAERKSRSTSSGSGHTSEGRGRPSRREERRR